MMCLRFRRDSQERLESLSCRQKYCGSRGLFKGNGLRCQGFGVAVAEVVRRQGGRKAENLQGTNVGQGT